MSYRVPGLFINSDSDSDDEILSCSEKSSEMSEAADQSAATGINQQDVTDQMTGVQIPQQQTNQETHQAGSFDPINIPPTVYQAICNQVTQQIMSQLQNFTQTSTTQTGPPPPPILSQSFPVVPSICQKKPSKWPVWDGSIVSFESHILNLRIKVEEDREFLGSNRSICLGIFNSLPVDKQPRVMSWYRTGGPDKTHNWELFLEHIVDQLENKQARQMARNQLQRMRMGSNQLFVDYLQDFELKLSQCDCTHWSDDMKISLLENGINSPLRNLLLSKSLPDDDYLKWTSKVKRVSGRLENTPSYRPKGCSGKKTWYLPQVEAPKNFVIEGSRVGASSGVDADGDTIMGGVNAVKIARAVVNALGETLPKQGNRKPPAEWRSPDDFRQLTKEGKCTRCCTTGHDTRSCPKYSAARRPASISHVKSNETATEVNLLIDQNLKEDSDVDLSGED